MPCARRKASQPAIRYCVGADQMPTINLSCTNCGSDSTQKLSSIHEAGTSHGTTKSVGSFGGMGQGGSVGGLHTSTGTTFNQTALATKLAPPQKKKTGKLLASFSFMAVFIPFCLEFAPTFIRFLVGFSLLGLGIFLFIRNKNYNSTEYPRLMEPWSKQFYCHRCENVFTPR